MIWAIKGKKKQANDTISGEKKKSTRGGGGKQKKNGIFPLYQKESKKDKGRAQLSIHSFIRC